MEGSFNPQIATRGQQDESIKRRRSAHPDVRDSHPETPTIPRQPMQPVRITDCWRRFLTCVQSAAGLAAAGKFPALCQKACGRAGQTELHCALAVIVDLSPQPAGVTRYPVFACGNAIGRWWPIRGAHKLAKSFSGDDDFQ
ncbi:hypothetical protein KCP70_24240 [Salmonella enterica subsp. enterica]|nr:hypothetical protein KCP70_24240 [Salmonella enterica subsp. enterica]